MKLRYKRLVIIISVATLVLSFFILTLIPTGGTPKSAEDADLLLNKNESINTLIKDYFQAKKTVNMDMLGTLVSDVGQIDREKFVAMAQYVEDYQNINCYVIESEEDAAYRVYVKYDMKLKDINTLAPCLGAFYVTSTSDDKYVIYLSALDEVQENFIISADKNKKILRLKDEVASGLQSAIEKDESFKQLYQKMDKGIHTDGEPAVASGAAAQ